MSQKRKVALVTGAASGIGRATAIKLAQNGAIVAVTDVNEKMGQETVSLIEEAGGAGKFYSLDVADKEAVKNTLIQIIRDFGPISLAVNNAGIGGVLAPTHQVQDADWDRMMQINLSGVFYCMRAALKVMKAQRRGTIVNTASAAGIGAASRMGAYAASKHAVIGMTKTAAVEYGKYGIRVNAICPTVIETPMGDSYLSDNTDLKEMMRQSVPMKRFGQPEEVARTICWLCSEDASYLNGVALPVDGGSTA